MKFKKGDVVWCKWPNVYVITDYHVACQVTAVYKAGWGEQILVKVLAGKFVGREYGVDAKDFELISRRAVIV